MEQSNSPTGAEDQEKRRKLVFSEDLLQAIAVAETHDEAKHLYQSVGPFVKERMDGGDFRFLKRTTKPIAPLLMKLFHRLKHHELAFHALMPNEDKVMILLIFLEGWLEGLGKRFLQPVGFGYNI